MPRKNARPAQKKALKHRRQKAAPPKRIWRPAASMISAGRAGPGDGEGATSRAALLSLATLIFRDEDP